MLNCRNSTLYTDFLRDLIAIQSVNPPGNERAAAEYVAEKLAEYGIECELTHLADQRANVLSKPWGDGPAIVLSGHLDVVPAGEGWETKPFLADFRDGKVYGRGACDMKGGIAAMMAAAVWAIRQSKGIRPFRLAFVADEEVDGQGTKALIRGLNPQQTLFCVIGEPTNNEIHIAHRGAIRFKIQTIGTSCHASAPQMGVNAIECMSRVIEAVHELNEDLKKVRHPVLPPPSICCTMIQAGTKDNTVPGMCEMIVDCRPAADDTVESFQKAILEKIETLGGVAKGAQVMLTPYINVPSGSVGKDSEIVRWARGCFIRSFEQEPVVRSFPACSDLGFFTRSGLPAILYGPGSIAQAHTIDEYVDIRQLERAFVFYCNCLTQV